jgi:hypothetical protein
MIDRPSTLEREIAFSFLFPRIAQVSFSPTERLGRF